MANMCKTLELIVGCSCLGLSCYLRLLQCECVCVSTQISIYIDSLDILAWIGYRI